MQVYCPDCGRMYDGRLSRCPSCGAPYTKTNPIKVWTEPAGGTGTFRRCPDCGKEISVRADLCPYCLCRFQRPPTGIAAWTTPRSTLVRCPDCGHGVSEQALSCPNCGRPMKEYIQRQKQAAASLLRDPNRVSLSSMMSSAGGCLALGIIILQILIALLSKKYLDYCAVYPSVPLIVELAFSLIPSVLVLRKHWKRAPEHAKWFCLMTALNIAFLLPAPWILHYNIGLFDFDTRPIWAMLWHFIRSSWMEWAVLAVYSVLLGLLFRAARRSGSPAKAVSAGENFHVVVYGTYGMTMAGAFQMAYRLQRPEAWFMLRLWSLVVLTGLMLVYFTVGVLITTLPCKIGNADKR